MFGLRCGDELLEHGKPIVSAVESVAVVFGPFEGQNDGNSFEGRAGNLVGELNHHVPHADGHRDAGNWKLEQMGTVLGG